MLVHGLTFDRRIWQPIIDRLGDSVTSLAIDLPGHGESQGEPVPKQDVADQIHSLVQAPGLEHPIGAVTPSPPRPPACPPPHTRRAAS